MRRARCPSAPDSSVRPGSGAAAQCSVQVLDGFVDFGGRFVADGDAIDAGVLEGEAHGLLAVFVVEDAFADELHADDAHAFGAGLLDVRRQPRGRCRGHSVVVVFAVHLGALVVHADHGDLQPLVPGTWRRAGRPWTEAPRLRMIFFCWASRMPSCQRLESLGPVVALLARASA